MTVTRRTAAASTARRPGARSPGSILVDLSALLGRIPALPGATCRGKPELFHLDEDADAEVIDRAKLICQSCPALDRCREWVAGLPERQRPSGVCAGELLPVPEPLPLSEDDADPKTPQKQRPVTAARIGRAAEWLAQQFTGGPAVSAEVKSAAKAAGFGQNTTHNAVKQLGVVVRRIGRESWWALPKSGPTATSPDRARTDENGSGAPEQRREQFDLFEEQSA